MGYGWLWLTIYDSMGLNYRDRMEYDGIEGQWMTVDSLIANISNIFKHALQVNTNMVNMAHIPCFLGHFPYFPFNPMLLPRFVWKMGYFMSIPRSESSNLHDCPMKILYVHQVLWIEYHEIHHVTCLFYCWLGVSEVIFQLMFPQYRPI